MRDSVQSTWLDAPNEHHGLFVSGFFDLGDREGDAIGSLSEMHPMCDKVSDGHSRLVIGRFDAFRICGFDFVAHHGSQRIEFFDLSADWHEAGQEYEGRVIDSQPITEKHVEDVFKLCASPY